MIKVMIVDDHPVVREGLEAMLESAHGFTVVASAADGESAASKVVEALPDVVALDIRLPGMDGFATLAKLRRFIPDIKAILLAGMPLQEELERARKMGASGYLPKNVDHKRLLQAFRDAVAGAPFIEEELPKVPCILSQRELDVLRYLALGKTREEVGVILGIGFETVRSHTRAIMAKLDVPNTAAAVNRAYEMGIMRP